MRYDDAMKELLARYKYRGDEQLKSLLGHMLVHAFQQIQIGLPSIPPTTGKKGMRLNQIITYVPVSEQRFLERGFNQAEQMAVELGRRVGVSVIPLLRRARHTDKQSFKSRGARIDDLQDVFVVDETGMERLIQQGQELSSKNLHIYIVDDVYTTGSTMNECAKILNLHMEAIYMGLTWAR
ncbi:DNA utilization protein GntX [compost metagenome]